MTRPDKYGCFDRKPIVTFGQPTCQFTHSELGAKDKRCEGCKERVEVKIEPVQPKRKHP